MDSVPAVPAVPVGASLHAEGEGVDPAAHQHGEGLIGVGPLTAAERMRAPRLWTAASIRAPAIPSLREGRWRLRRCIRSRGAARSRSPAVRAVGRADFAEWAARSLPPGLPFRGWGRGGGPTGGLGGLAAG